MTDKEEWIKLINENLGLLETSELGKLYKHIRRDVIANLPQKEKEPYILCSAIWFDDGKEWVHQPKNVKTGFVITGMRHHNCFMTLKIVSELFDIKDHVKGKSIEKEQGFLTNENMFVNREEAYLIAIKSGQAVKKTKATLYSEDLY
jgi:hypothetical protein